jgi:hypothetical protein
MHTTILLKQISCFPALDAKGTCLKVKLISAALYITKFINHLYLIFFKNGNKRLRRKCMEGRVFSESIKTFYDWLYFHFLTRFGFYISRIEAEHTSGYSIFPYVFPYLRVYVHRGLYSIAAPYRPSAGICSFHVWRHLDNYTLPKFPWKC